MNIGVVSDTHRNRGGLEEVVSWMSTSRRISTLYHLGDDYEDVLGLVDSDLEIRQVPGIYHPEYRNGRLAPVARETISGIRLLLVHSIEKDLAADDATVVDIILHGHTHHAELRLEDGTLYMNPGHLKAGKDRTAEPTFSILSIHDTSVGAEIINTAYETVDSISLVRSENGLYRS